MSALEELQELYTADPDAERISLRARQLERVDAEVEYIHVHFPRTRHLDLSDNALDALPTDFGQLLPKLVALDLTKNRLRSVADLGEVLQQCASLKSLSVSLKNATEEKLLLVMLPKLRILNGTPLAGPASPSPPPPPLVAESLLKPVDALATALLSPSTASNSSAGGERDDGPSPPAPDSSSGSQSPPPPPPPPRPATASPSGKISSPQDKRTLRLQFASLRTERQAAAHERQRVVAGATDALALSRTQHRRATGSSGARAAPTAREGGSSGAVRSKSSSVRPTETPASISDDRTDWCKLLKSHASGGPAHAHESREQTATTESFLTELKTVVKAFHACGATTASSERDGGGAQQLRVYEQLDQHVASLAAQLGRQEREALLPRGADAGEIARLKSSIAVLQTRWNLLEVCGLYGVERASGVDNALGGAFERLLQMQRQVLKALQLQQAAVAAKAQQLQQAALQASPAQPPQQPQLKQQMTMLLEVAESLESDLEAAQTRLQQEKAQRELLEQENWSLKRENDAYKRKSPAARAGASPAVATPASAGSAAAAARGERPPGASRQRIRRRPNTPGRSRSASPERAGAATAGASRSVSAPARIRNLTLKQLVDLIHCITASKLRSDTRALEVAGAGAPRETMEQHMYAYLNQRFGLHALIVDYASAIWKGCEAFAARENDAAVFLALLRSELDEGFLAVKTKLKQALVDLLRAYFQAAYPLKQEVAIATLVQNRLQHLIFADEWHELLTYLYDAQDSATLLRLVQQKADERLRAASSQRATRSSSRSAASASPPRLSLPFAVFEQVLFDYQLHGRIKLLEEFRAIFASFDKDRVGIVNHEAFVSIVRRIAPKKSDAAIDKLLEALDPFQHDVVTFSDAVSCLMSDIRAKKPSPSKPVVVIAP
ncbi:hypothetical protein PybrP1_008246 [[Pythium] brassicae (nom. inval.)]|nr:hypothetical protein PybrP1_008246 [[Pythium] brassicae (nom. inval.)]